MSAGAVHALILLIIIVIPWNSAFSFQYFIGIRWYWHQVLEEEVQEDQRVKLHVGVVFGF